MRKTLQPATMAAAQSAWPARRPASRRGRPRADLEPNSASSAATSAAPTTTARITSSAPTGRRAREAHQLTTLHSNHSPAALTVNYHDKDDVHRDQHHTATEPP